LDSQGASKKLQQNSSCDKIMLLQSVGSLAHLKMIDWDIIRITGKHTTAIEFDQAAWAWYVRFSRRKVAKTVSEDKPGGIVAIDLDDRNEVIGVELLGIREFSLRTMVRLVGPRAAGIDLSKTRFVPTGLERELQPA
jgi:hypothetical protein